MRSAVELAKDWRTDRNPAPPGSNAGGGRPGCYADHYGVGDVIEPELGLAAIGSGGSYAHSAARALLENTSLTARDVVEKSLAIAGDLCIYTNQSFVIEVLE